MAARLLNSRLASVALVVVATAGLAALAANTLWPTTPPTATRVFTPLPPRTALPPGMPYP